MEGGQKLLPPGWNLKYSTKRNEILPRPEISLAAFKKPKMIPKVTALDDDVIKNAEKRQNVLIFKDILRRDQKVYF